MKRTLATLAAAGIALTALAPAAHAAPVGAFAVLTLANGQISTTDCRVVDGALRGAGLVGENTTRTDLAAGLHTMLGGDLQTKLVTSQTIGAVADRALECGVVKPDPVQLPAGSSQVMDIVALVSSEIR